MTMSPPMGLREELALERVAVVAFRREADSAWRARQYTWARLMKDRAEAAEARVAELEGRLAP